MSLLIDLLSKRVPQANGSPYEAMRCLVASLRKETSLANPLTQFGKYLDARRVLEHAEARDLNSDGYIQPLGRSFEQGFRMVLRTGSPEARRRFTAAHELCHTFFYQLVPEIKFALTEVDPVEERLCNFGAAELLIPEVELKAQLDERDPSLLTLVTLAKHFRASTEAMLLRLRSLNLWYCDLSLWHRRSDGTYVLDRIFGGDKQRWYWGYPETVQKTWDTAGSKLVSGWAHIFYFDEGRNVPLAKRVHVQSVNRGDSVLVLWSERELGGNKRRNLPLFDRKRKRPIHSHAQTAAEYPRGRCK